MISRVRSGQAERSTSSVTSATAAPSRGVPSWWTAGSQRSSIPNVSKMAPCTWAFDRATKKKPTLRSRQAEANVVEHPAESVRTTTGRVTVSASSPARWPQATSLGRGDDGRRRPVGRRRRPRTHRGLRHLLPRPGGHGPGVARPTAGGPGLSRPAPRSRGVDGPPDPDPPGRSRADQVVVARVLGGAHRSGAGRPGPFGGQGPGRDERDGPPAVASRVRTAMGAGPPLRMELLLVPKRDRPVRARRGGLVFEADRP